MFQSMLDHKDLLFQDSTVRLVSVTEDLQNYRSYLGVTFTRAMDRMEGIDCITDNSATSTNGLTRYLSIIVCIFTMFYMCLN